MGPVDPASVGGSRYMVSLIDDKSGFAEVGVLGRKSEATGWVEVTLRRWQRQTGQWVKRFRSDQGAEFRSSAFRSFLQHQGIAQEFSAVYTPQQNGVAEQLNRTLTEKAKAMLADSGLGSRFWAEAAHTAAFLRNRTLAAGQTATPFEQFFGRKPRVGYLRVLCSPAYIHVPLVRRKKLDDNCVEGIMVGYEPGIKGYKFWEPSQQRSWSAGTCG